MTSTMRIDHDDDTLDIMDEVNRALGSIGFVFVMDETEHDGYVIYGLEKLEDQP